MSKRCYCSRLLVSRVISEAMRYFADGSDLTLPIKSFMGIELMDVVQQHGYMPEKIYSKNGKAADDGFDGANCYDNIVHVIILPVFQSFGVPESAIAFVLAAIQEMKYFLRTAYGGL